MVVFFSATLLRYMGSGPLWYLIVENLEQPCIKNWWYTLIYIQNYIQPYDQVDFLFTLPWTKS